MHLIPSGPSVTDRRNDRQKTLNYVCHCYADRACLHHFAPCQHFHIRPTVSMLAGSKNLAGFLPHRGILHILAQQGILHKENHINFAEIK